LVYTDIPKTRVGFEQGWRKFLMGSRRLIAGILLAVGVSGIVYGVNMLRKDCIDRVEKKLDVELRNHVSVMKEQ